MRSPWFAMSLGSSPLTRGKHEAWVFDAEAGRLIPTHAGKTRGRSKTPCAKPAHPHSRGENFVGSRRRGHSFGSSPLTRGKPSGELATVRIVRLIPTHAGKTFPSVGATLLTTAHPHSRGENALKQSRKPWRSGSSPLTRGKQGRQGSANVSDRLIPTHAGKTRHGGRHRPRRAAHPHSRGENARKRTSSSSR